MSKLNLHVHNDIDEAARYYKIPLTFYHRDSIYIMQGENIVFIGDVEIAKKWLDRNYGKLCKPLPYLTQSSKA